MFSIKIMISSKDSHWYSAELLVISQKVSLNSKLKEERSFESFSEVKNTTFLYGPAVQKYGEG